MCVACDKSDQVHDNIYAAGNTIEALHGIERWGTDDTVEQALTGFAAPPCPRRRSHMPSSASSPGATREEIDAAYR
jgi:hypothetical protein